MTEITSPPATKTVPPRSAYQVISELCFAHRFQVDAVKSLARADADLLRAQCEALKVFKVNGWPAAIRDGETIIRLQFDSVHVPYLTVEVSADIPSVFTLKGPDKAAKTPAELDQEARS